MTVTMPGYTHPSLANYETFAREWMSRRRDPFLIHRPVSEEAIYSAPLSPLGEMKPPLVFTIDKAAGPAPFVGDPRYQKGFYVWFVAHDEYGRSIATEANLQIMDSLT